MRTSAPQSEPLRVKAAKPSLPVSAHFGRSLALERTIGSQAVRLLPTEAAHGASALALQRDGQGPGRGLTQRAGPGGLGSESAVVTPRVHEVLRATGQPLPAETRAFMEPRFGHDFSGVRVHTDAKAAQSAQDVNANAYTVGPNIVFGADHYAPGTEAGRQLLSHELTHVIQQRGSPVPVARGISAPGDFHERQAEAVAKGVMHGGEMAGVLHSGPRPTHVSLQRQPAPRRAVQPNMYDHTVHIVAAVDPSVTVASASAALTSDKVNQGEITSFAVTKGGHAEIFLLALLYGLAARARWGTETDIVTAIDWPARPGALADQGRVTVRIDSNGAASARLIARGPVPAVTQTTTATALQTNFKLAAVSDDGTATWSPSDLNNVGAALAILPPDDKKALEEVELIRVSAIPGKPDDAGQFEFPNPAASDASAANIHAKLRLANRAFSNDNVQFFGGTAKTVPSSFQTILHEVGHAVESEVYRSKWKAHAAALAETKAAGNVPESDKRKAERAAIEKKIAKATSASAKSRLENKLTGFDLELAKRSEEAADKKAAETKLKDKEAEVTTLDAAGESARMKKFLALVTSKRIRPFTTYARTGNAEFYAEAYSLWLVDPEFLSANYSDIYNFFQNGDYRK